jgi:hypothetical protein
MREISQTGQQETLPEATILIICPSERVCEAVGDQGRTSPRGILQDHPSSIKVRAVLVAAVWDDEQSIRRYQGPLNPFAGGFPVISQLVEPAFGISVVATCRRPRIIATLTAAVALISMQASAEEQTGAPRLRDIPGPNPLWFLGPLVPSSPKINTSMEPVAVDLTNRAGKVMALRIPRAYIAQLSNPSEDAQTFVNVVVYLPDYLPRFLADQAGQKTHGEVVNGIELNSHDEIVIDIQVTAPGTMAKFIEWKRGNHIYAGTFEGKFDLYYDVYQPPQGPPKPRKESGYLIPQGRDDLIITFRSNLATSKMLGCRMQFELEDLMLEVSFWSTNLDQYIKIKDAVTELVTSFIVRVAP